MACCSRYVRSVIVLMFYMAKPRSIVWKFFDLVEQEKDGKKIKNAACKICVDTILTYAGGTSNLMHHLEAKHRQ